MEEMPAVPSFPFPGVEPVAGGASDSEAGSGLDDASSSGSGFEGLRDELREEIKLVRASIEAELRDEFREELRIVKAGIDAELKEKFSEEGPSGPTCCRRSWEPTGTASSSRRRPAR